MHQSLQLICINLLPKSASLAVLPSLKVVGITRRREELVVSGGIGYLVRHGLRRPKVIENP